MNRFLTIFIITEYKIYYTTFHNHEVLWSVEASYYLPRASVVLLVASYTQA